MKISILALAFSAITFLAAPCAFASTLNAHDFGNGNLDSRHDDDGRFNANDRNNKDGKENDFASYETDHSNNKLCDPKDNGWSNDDRNHGPDKISTSWSPYPGHSEGHDDHNWSKMSYPAYLPWPNSDKDHHDYNHHVDHDDDEDDHKKVENYYRDICDHKKDHDYDPSHRCDPKDPGKAPLPGAFFLFASALAWLGFFGFKRHNLNRTI